MKKRKKETNWNEDMEYKNIVEIYYIFQFSVRINTSNILEMRRDEHGDDGLYAIRWNAQTLCVSVCTCGISCTRFNRFLMQFIIIFTVCIWAAVLIFI